LLINGCAHLTVPGLHGDPTSQVTVLGGRIGMTD